MSRTRRVLTIVGASVGLWVFLNIVALVAVHAGPWAGVGVLALGAALPFGVSSAVAKRNTRRRK